MAGAIDLCYRTGEDPIDGTGKPDFNVKILLCNWREKVEQKVALSQKIREQRSYFAVSVDSLPLTESNRQWKGRKAKKGIRSPVL